jgi:hypothetical protein
MSSSEKQLNKKNSLLDFDLDLPDGKDFKSKRINVPYLEMFKFCESLLPKLNSDEKFQERRRRGKEIRVQFEL